MLIRGVIWAFAATLAAQSAFALPYVPLWCTGKYSAHFGNGTAGYSANALKVSDIALDREGNIVAVMGGSGQTTTNVVKVSPAGAVLWTKDITCGTSCSMWIKAVEVDGSNNIFLAGDYLGFMYLAKWNKNGSELWTYSVTGTAAASLVLQSNFAYVGGGASVYKYDISGKSPVFSISKAVKGDIVDMLVDPTGNVYVSEINGTSPTTPWIEKIKYDFSTVPFSYSKTGGRMAWGPDHYIYALRMQSSCPGCGNSGDFYKINPSNLSTAEASTVSPDPLQGYNSGSMFGAMPAALAFTPDGNIALACSLQDTSSGQNITSEIRGVALVEARIAKRCDTCPDSSWSNLWIQAQFAPLLKSYCSSSDTESITFNSIVATSGRIYAGGTFSGGSCGDGGRESPRYWVMALGDSQAEHAVGKGKIEVRRNIIHTEDGDKAIIIIHGAPGGKVALAVIGPSGYALGAINPRTAWGQTSGDSEWRVNLDSNGEAIVYWDGKLDGKVPLKTGVYWIAVGGASVNDRKQVMVISRDQ